LRKIVHRNCEIDHSFDKDFATFPDEMLKIFFIFFALCYSASLETRAGADSSRVDCLPEDGKFESDCRARGCLWETSETPGVPWCYFPDGYPTYNMVRQYDATTMMGAKEVAVRVLPKI